MLVRFGDCEVDLDRVEIRRGGEPVPVQPQVFNVIEYLVRHRDRVVSKEELLDNVWGDRFVGESTLTSRIKFARRALGDDGAVQAVIKTVHGRGYRFVADLDVGSGQGPGAAAVDETAPDGAASVGGDGNADTATASNDAPVDGWPLVGRALDLERILDWFDSGEVDTVILEGPVGVEATRFVSTCARYAERHGVPTARIIGHDSAAGIPLAVLAPLLPAEVFDTDQPSDDLARASVLRRAIDAITETIVERAGPDGRMLVHVEAPDSVDAMSATALRTLTDTGRLFTIVNTVGRAGDGSIAHQDAPGTESVRLDPLSETDVDILLHRVLGAPIDASTLHQLTLASGGLPEFLRDVVEASRASGTFVLDDGVWRLVGPPSSRSTRSWDTSSLSEEAILLAGTLAIAGSSTIGFAEDNASEESIDELDRAGLLALDARNERVALADPLLASEVERSIGPLRRRAVIRALARSLESDPTADPVVLLRVLQHSNELDHAVDHDVVLRAAGRAMIAGDMDTAGDLVDVGADPNDPHATMIAAEVALARGQWGRAESLFESIDVTAVGEAATSQVLRRRAAISFYAHGRYDEAIAELEAEAAGRPDRTAHALHARRAAMLAYLGRVDDTRALTGTMDELGGVTRLEVVLSDATASLLSGRLLEALARLDDAEAFVGEVPEAWAAEPRDGVLIIRSLALMELGDIDAASRLVRASLPFGRRTPLGYLPAVAAEIELAAGRPRAAREFVRQATQSSHRHTFPQYALVADAVLALTDHRLRSSRADAGRQSVIDALSRLTGELRYKASVIAAEIGVEPPGAEPDWLLRLADESASVGADLRAAQLLVEVARHDPSGVTARSVVDRIAELVAGFDGRSWPARLEEVRDLAAGRPLDQTRERYLTLGMLGDADRPHLRAG